MITATRYHDFSYGHRVYKHESKCAHLHGHNGRVHFEIGSDKLDDIGRVLDFSVIKSILCYWIEVHWDHRFIVAENDPMSSSLLLLDSTVVIVNFNPTAENMAQFLVDDLAPRLLKDTNCRLLSCVIEETRKCSVKVTASCEL